MRTGQKQDTTAQRENASNNDSEPTASPKESANGTCRRGGKTNAAKTTAEPSQTPRSRPQTSCLKIASEAAEGTGEATKVTAVDSYTVNGSATGLQPDHDNDDIVVAPCGKKRLLPRLSLNTSTQSDEPAGQESKEDQACGHF